MLSGPILATLLKLALPTMVVLLAQTAVNIAEAYYVGFLGTDALAGVAMVFPVFMLMTMMSNGGIGSGVASAWRAQSAPTASRMPSAGVSHPDAGRHLRRVVHPRNDLGRPGAVSGAGGRQEALEAALKYSNYLFPVRSRSGSSTCRPPHCAVRATSRCRRW